MHACGPSSSTPWWAHTHTRTTGATLCATEDGRRLFLFGGHDGSGPLNDCYCFEVQQLAWSCLRPSGALPEPREGHTAAMLGKYMLISGGCGGAAAAGASATKSAAAAAAAAGAAPPANGSSSAAAAGADGSSSSGSSAARRLCDTFILDLFNGPAWEQLSDGAGLGAMWLKQVRKEESHALGGGGRGMCAHDAAVRRS